MRTKIDEWQRKGGVSYRIRLFVGRRCVFRIGAKNLKGQSRRDVEATAAATVAAYKGMQASRSQVDPQNDSPGAEQAKPNFSAETSKFCCKDAKQRFLAAVENEIGLNRCAEIESHFRQSVEPFFLKKHNNSNPEQWPPIFDLFRTWVKNRRRADGKPGHIKAQSANRHIASMNKFLRFCREVYGLAIRSNCKPFGKKILEKESQSRDKGMNAHDVLTEEEFVRFREVAYSLNPQRALAYDLCFGLGLRRGEAIALRSDRVHLDDPQLGPMGYVEINEQYTNGLATKGPTLELPKWEKTRVVPIPYKWLHDALRERMSGRLPTHPRDNEDGLRYLSERYQRAASFWWY